MLYADISRYQMLFWLCLGLSGLCFGLAIWFFVRFHIPAAIGYLTGRNERKSIRELEQKVNDPQNPVQRKFVVVKEILLVPADEYIREGGVCL